MRAAIALTILFASASSAFATNYTVKSMGAAADENIDLQRLINEAGATLVITNSWLKQKGQPVLFCQPGKLRITSDQFRSILNGRVQANPDSGEVDIQYFPATLLEGLRDNFPCSDSIPHVQ